MKQLVAFFLFLILFCNNVSGKTYCEEQYDVLREMEKVSRDVFNKKYRTSIWRIAKAKSNTRKALKLAYKTLADNECSNYSSIVEIIIRLELLLGNASKAEVIALERLNRIYPDWKKPEKDINTSFIGVLCKIQPISKSNFYYKNARKKGASFPCDTYSHAERIILFHKQAQIIFKNYEKAYCYKYLQGSTLIINEDIGVADPYWADIYEMLIISMSTHFTYEEIKQLYEKAEIQKKELTGIDSRLWQYKLDRSLYYFEFGGVTVSIKSVACPDGKNKIKRCAPQDCEAIKYSSPLYEIINRYAESEG